MYRIAVLFTCYNRKEKTLRCVRSLLEQDNKPSFDLYVCDDASTDGTIEAILELIPRAVIIHGTGNLFWSRGMHVAMQAAVKKKYDLYLMINDDVEFIPTMWESMHQAYEDNGSCGIIGCTLSRETGMQSYGGSRFIYNKGCDYIGSMLAPEKDYYVECDLANWNCFLIDAAVVEKVGLVDNRYEHSMGDFDYSFRMKENGFNLYLAKEYVGHCENNKPDGTFRDSNVLRLKRCKKLFAANGLPVKSWHYFVFRYYKHGRFRNFIVPYIKYIVAITLGRKC